MMRSVVAGVDAGGTTTIVAASAGDRTVVARDDPANPSTAGVERAAERIAAAIVAASGSHAPAAIYVGAAGAGRVRVATALHAALLQRFPGAAIAVEDDARIALRAAIPNGPGAVVVAGTGSVAYAENGPSRARVGGDGYALGDQGSAYAVGAAAVRALVCAFDGRARARTLAGIARSGLGVVDRDALLDVVYGDGGRVDVARIAALAAAVVAAARDGDDEAHAVVDDAARQLARIAAVALARAGIPPEATEIAVAGGLLRDAFVAASFERHFRIVVPNCRIVAAVADDGAALAALRLGATLVTQDATR
jgi:N-acetylglucosamine kinase